MMTTDPRELDVVHAAPDAERSLAIDARGISYAYARSDVLHGLDLAVPAGSICALLGPNGAGKTTLMQILAGLRRPRSGQVTILGRDAARLSARDRTDIGYVAEGQSLPKWMRLRELEAWLAPLYPRWDRALADELRRYFDLDPRRKLGAMSRGEFMKAALLCALAPRPRLLIMDEPFTGMDVMVRDALVRGLLEATGATGWTVVICSHDIGELELLADWTAFINGGRLRLNESVDSLRRRFRRVEVILPDETHCAEFEPGWLTVEQAGRRITFVADAPSDETLRTSLRSRFAGAERIEVQDPTLREVFVAVTRHHREIATGGRTT